MRQRFRPYKPLQPGSPKATIASAMIEVGGPGAVAERMRRKRSVVYAYGDPDHPTHAPFDAVCELVKAGARAPIEFLAGLAGGSFTAAETPQEHFAVLVERAARERGVLDAQTISALADGTIDARERGALADGFGRHIAALNAVRARLISEGSES